MKSTGVVRRVDDLIRDGESLEIFVDREMIALKKFSKMNDIEEISKQIVDIMYNAIGKNVFITDRDRFVAGAGDLRKKFLNKNISKYLETIMNDRKNIIENSNHNIELVDLEEESLSYVISPIIMNGDAVGLVLILSEKSDIGKTEEKMASVFAQFLGKHIEE